MRELRELVRRCDALKAARVQELNRQKAGFASTAVAASIAAQQIDAVFAEVRHLIEADPALRQNLALVRSITRFGEISAVILLAELPNIAELRPKGLAAFAGLSSRETSSGSSRRSTSSISRIGSERLRRTLFMCALSAKRTNKVLAGFVERMTLAGKPPKVVLVAIARKLLVFAHAVIRAQELLAPFPSEPSSA